jgi:hypothetical protein
MIHYLVAHLGEWLGMTRPDALGTAEGVVLGSIIVGLLWLAIVVIFGVAERMNPR